MSVPGAGRMKISARRAISFSRRSAHDQLLAMQLVRALHPRRQHRMRLRGIAADDDDQLGLLDIGHRAGIAAIAHRAPQSRGRR